MRATLSFGVGFTKAPLVAAGLLGAIVANSVVVLVVGASDARAEVDTAPAAPVISRVRQLTFDGARAGEGYYSADGSKMIFQSEREPGNPFYQIYTLDFETGDVARVSTGLGKTTCAWLHPNGRLALYASTHDDPDAATKMAAERDFRASGKTRRYAWDYDPTFELYATDLETGALTRLTNAEGYDAEGAYSPDGSKIVFASNRAAYVADLSPEEAERLEKSPSFFMDLYVMDADGSNVRRLTTAPGYDGGPFWSADGERIVWRRFNADGKSAEIYTMAADGSDERRITELGALSWAPFFHPSGEYIVFSTNLQGYANFELYLVDAAGAREPVRVTDREKFDGLPTFSPDGATLSWTSSATARGGAQIFLASWNHEAALDLLESAPIRRSAAVRPDMDATTPAITVADLKAHVEKLASEEMGGRLTGEEGERLATAYVAEAFAAMGLAPAGEDGSYFQSFSFTAGVALGAKNEIAINGGARPAGAYALSEDWTPLAFSKSGAVEPADVVFVGYGIITPDETDGLKIDSYASADVVGKWALMWRGGPTEVSDKERGRLVRFTDLRYKASIARSKGAIGMIVVPGPDPAFRRELPRLSLEASGAASLPAFAVTRDAGGSLVTAALADAADTITAAIEKGEPFEPRPVPGVKIGAEIDIELTRREGRNVLARLDLDGVDGGAAPVLVGAHVDHLGRGETSGSLAKSEEQGLIHYGADDNASGTAAVIEAAQNLAAAKAAGALKGARDIVFAAWSGEELGLLGSAHYVKDLQDRAGAEDLDGLVAAYINLDMVGRLRESVIMGALASSTRWRREIERRNAVVGLPITTSDDPYLPTDGTSFYLAGAPVLSIFTGVHDDYHTPRDVPGLLNYEGLRDITRFTALMARGLALDAEEPDYVRVARRPGRGDARRSANYLGTIPAYGSDGELGVALSGVAEGGPADKAGVQGGDRVIGLAGESVNDIYDLIRVLNGLKPKQPTTITVKRGEREVTLDITPGVRD